MDAIISPIVEQLTSLVLKQVEQEVTLVLEAKNEVGKLAKNFKAIQAVCDDAESKQIKNANVRQWLDNLRDVSYDIDDVLDEWNTYILKRQIEGGSEAADHLPRQKVWYLNILTSRCFCVRSVAVRQDIAVKIKELNKRLIEIEEEKKRYSFDPTIRYIEEESNVNQRMTASVIDALEIVGRDTDKDRLISMLLSESSHGTNLNVISVIGMGGLGKTTLAQLAYNDKRVHSHFQKKMWVCVSDPLDEVRVAKAILEGLKKYTPRVNSTQLSLSPNELNPLLESIRDSVKESKFLLVLDDVWCEQSDRWQKLKASLTSGSLGSKILVTTRKEEVADAIGLTKFFLGKLPRKESWSCFFD